MSNIPVPFDSRQKILAKALEVDLQLGPPTTPMYGIYVVRTTVAHNLGYMPFFRVAYQPFGDGVLWDMAIGTRAGNSVTNPNNTGQTGPYLTAWPDDNNINLELGFTTNVLTQSYPIHLIVYHGYRLD